ncbi:hypothetical protein YC2023_039488 [Brassica napus]
MRRVKTKEIMDTKHYCYPWYTFRDRVCEEICGSTRGRSTISGRLVYQKCSSTPPHDPLSKLGYISKKFVVSKLPEKSSYCHMKSSKCRKKSSKCRKKFSKCRKRTFGGWSDNNLNFITIACVCYGNISYLQSISPGLMLHTYNEPSSFF